MTTVTEITPVPIPVEDLTTAEVEGAGVFDVLMRAMKSHLQQEYERGRIKGAEYATVYLGAMDSVMRTSMEFLVARLQHQKTLKEIAVLEGQKCKLDAEFDLIQAQRLKVIQETELLAQRTLTERAQTVATGVDQDSVIGRQKLLYKAQTDGFSRDAEQKAAKLMIDSWNVRRTTDEGTVADTVNKLSDADVGRAVTKLLDGVNA